MKRPMLLEKAVTALLGPAGHTDARLRRALFERMRTGTGAVPEEMASLLDKIAERPWTVVDSDILRLSEAGYTEDQIYELLLAVAAGAGVRRVDAGLRAMEGAS